MTQKWNVIAEGWTNGKYCFANHLESREQAQYGADNYRARYEGRQYPNGRGWYPYKNFRVIQVNALHIFWYDSRNIIQIKIFTDWYDFADYTKQENLAGRAVSIINWEYLEHNWGNDE